MTRNVDTQISSKTVETLTAAWYDKAMGSADELAHLESGWALFKPERAQEIRDEAEKNRDNYLYWLRQNG